MLQNILFSCSNEFIIIWKNNARIEAGPKYGILENDRAKIEYVLTGKPQQTGSTMLEIAFEKELASLLANF